MSDLLGWHLISMYAPVFACVSTTANISRLQPSIIVVPYIEGDPPTAETLLSPFRTRVTPMFAQTTFAPTFNIVSHGVDPFLLNAPPRSVIAGACFSKLYDDVLEWVLAEWLGFTEREEFKQSLIMFEFWRSGTVDAVPVSATAHPVRVPHWYLAMGTRSVFRPPWTCLPKVT